MPGILWCPVPPGPFIMGSGDEDEMADREKPQHDNESITEGYLISRYPVTVVQFGAFVEAGGYREARYWEEAEREGMWQAGKVTVGWRRAARGTD